MTLTFRQLESAGRCGNQLWQIASTAGIAWRRGEPIRFPPWSYRPYFSCPEEWWEGPIPRRALDAHLSPEAGHIAKWWRLYLQDHRLFRDIAEDVRRWFQPSVEALRVFNRDGPAMEMWSRFPWDDRGRSEAIALHVRRGDTVVNGPGIQPCAPIQFYRDALLTFPMSMPVVVFSDDPSWCRDVLLPSLPPASLGQREVMVVDHGPGRHHDPHLYARQQPTDWLDLQLMAVCSHHIISNSSYAWWGAFLSGDPAPRYPSRWFGPDLIARGCDKALVIPDGWQEIEVTEEPITC